MDFISAGTKLDTLSSIGSKEDAESIKKMREKFGDDAAYAIVNSPNVKKLLTDITHMQADAVKTNNPLAGAIDQAGNVLASQLKGRPDLVTKLNNNLTSANIGATEQALKTNVGGLTKALPTLISATDASQFSQGIPAAVAQPSSAPAKLAAVTPTAPSSQPQVGPRFNRHAQPTESGAPAKAPVLEAVSAPQTPAPTQPVASAPQVTPVSQTTTSAAADSGTPSPQMIEFLSKPENAGFKDLLGSLNDDQKKVVQTTFAKMSKDNPDTNMLDQISDEQKKHPEFFKTMLANLKDGPKDAAGFQTSLTNSMNGMKALGGMDMLVGLIGKLLDGLGLHSFAASLQEKFAPMEEKIAANPTMAASISEKVDMVSPFMSMFNGKSGSSSPKQEDQPRNQPPLYTADNNGQTPPLPKGNLVGPSNSDYSTARSATPDQPLTVNGATYLPANAPPTRMPPPAISAFAAPPAV